MVLIVEIVGNESDPLIATFGTFNVFVDALYDKFALASAHPILPVVGSLKKNSEPGEYVLGDAKEDNCKFEPICTVPPICMVFVLVLYVNEDEVTRVAFPTVV